MARLARRVAALACVAALARATPGAAQALATLHVRSFAMTVDRAAVRVGETLHLTVSAHVDERVFELDNVTLPDLTGFDVAGDERRCVSAARGTDCLETLALQPTVAGERTIAGTIMDAVDARTGKPSRFATNSVAVRVADAPPHVPAWVGELAWSIVLALLPFLLVAIAAYALIWGFGRRRPAAGPPAPAPPPAAPVVDEDARLRALVDALAREPTRANAVAVRAALRARIGARDDETLGDLAARYRNGERPRVLAALAAIERASFCEPAAVAGAVEEALPSLRS